MPGQRRTRSDAEHHQPLRDNERKWPGRDAGQREISERQINDRHADAKSKDNNNGKLLP